MKPITAQFELKELKAIAQMILETSAREHPSVYTNDLIKSKNKKDYTVSISNYLRWINSKKEK